MVQADFVVNLLRRRKTFLKDMSSQSVDTNVYSHRIEKDDRKITEWETEARIRADHWLIWLFVVNWYANVSVVLKHLISLESILSISLSVGFTLFAFYQTVSFC